MREGSKTLGRRARGVAASGGGNVRRAPGVLYTTRTTACFARLVVHSHATMSKGIFVFRPTGPGGGGAHIAALRSLCNTTTEVTGGGQSMCTIRSQDECKTSLG